MGKGKSAIFLFLYDHQIFMFSFCPFFPQIFTTYQKKCVERWNHTLTFLTELLNVFMYSVFFMSPILEMVGGDGALDLSLSVCPEIFLCD